MAGEYYLSFNEKPDSPRGVGALVDWARKVFSPAAVTEGDDLSHYQAGKILSWAAKQVENKFSILKLGEGGLMDSALLGFVQGAVQVGTQVMGYYFFRSNVSGTQQADDAIAMAEQVTPILGYKPVIWADVETVDGADNVMRITRLSAFMNAVHVWNPGKVGIYSSAGFANQYLTPVPGWINNYWHWVAHWTGGSTPIRPTGWSLSRLKVWQYGVWDNYAWSKPVPGALPDVDVNRFMGTADELQAFTGAVGLTLEERVARLEAAVFGA